MESHSENIVQVPSAKLKEIMLGVATSIENSELPSLEPSMERMAKKAQIENAKAWRTLAELLQEDVVYIFTFGQLKNMMTNPYQLPEDSLNKIQGYAHMVPAGFARRFTD